MGDFAQLGPVPTLHRLGRRPVAELEADLVHWSVERPIAVIIPALHEELERPALPRIVAELARIPYLEEVVLGLDGATACQVARARDLLAPLPMPHRVLWHDGPRLLAIDEQLRHMGLAPPDRGKGRNLWYCLGYVLAAGRAEVIAFHDADILTYAKPMLGRLLYPVAHPDFGYVFAKGYYQRSDAQTLNGRVARLLMTPLLRALTTVVGHDDYLHYLAGFRYPLAGEVAMSRHVAASIAIPSDWGVEVGVLGEVYAHHGHRGVCQVEIADRYDHKHQPLSAGDRTHGLHKMAIDIVRTLFTRLATGGTDLPPTTIDAIVAAYRRAAVDLMDVYRHDALLNGLTTSNALERAAVEVFAIAVDEAGTDHRGDPRGSAPFPSWSTVRGAAPEVPPQLVAAVDADNGLAGNPSSDGAPADSATTVRNGVSRSSAGRR
jgi:glucosyl-3-phosphoglycerate synthase